MRQSSGSPTWARTRDLRINSPSLYRLSYRGTREARIIVTRLFTVNRLPFRSRQSTQHHLLQPSIDLALRQETALFTR